MVFEIIVVILLFIIFAFIITILILYSNGKIVGPISTPLDAFVKQDVTFTAEVSVDSFTSSFYYHKWGNLVMVETFFTTINTGSTANLVRYHMTTAIPSEFTPLTSHFGTVALANAGSFNQTGNLLIQGNGQVYLYPATNSAFAPGSYINGGTFFYFLNT